MEGFSGEGHAGLGEVADHDLRVDQVLRTTQRDDADRGHGVKAEMLKS